MSIENYICPCGCRHLTSKSHLVTHFLFALLSGTHCSIQCFSVDQSNITVRENIKLGVWTCKPEINTVTWNIWRWRRI